MHDLRATHVMRMYIQDVLGVKSFLAGSEFSSEIATEVEVSTTPSFVVKGGTLPRVLFLRAKTNVSIFEGDLEELYKKILQSLKRPESDLATIEWDAGHTSGVLQYILNAKPQIVFALGAEAGRFMTDNQTALKELTIIKSHDPEQVSQNEDIKRKLWNDLKTVIKHLELS